MHPFPFRFGCLKKPFSPEESAPGWLWPIADASLQRRHGLSEAPAGVTATAEDGRREWNGGETIGKVGSECFGLNISLVNGG